MVFDNLSEKLFFCCVDLVTNIRPQQGISELPLASFSKRVLVENHSYENEFNLHLNEISFSYERMGTKTRFEKESKGN